tara:strand:+ start:1253 stop:2911 length:1659 start_codon:yes stop_codon:yes gene_type:complete
MSDYKKKYLKYKLKYLSKKGGSLSTKLKEIEIKLFGKEQEGSAITRTDNIEQFLKINLDKGVQSRIRNINSTIHFLPNNYVSPHVPNKGIALFIIGNEPGHESCAFGTCYMLKSRLNIHNCDFLYTENKMENIKSTNVTKPLLQFNNKSLLLQLEQKLRLYLRLEYTHLYLFIECHGNNMGIYCGDTFTFNDFIYIWKKYYDKYFFAMLISDTCNSHILIRNAEEQEAKNIIGFNTNDCYSYSQLRIVKAITFSALNFANINNLNALLFVEYLKNITKKWVETNLYENNIYYNITVNHTTIDNKNISLVVNYDSYNSINNINADFYPLNSTNTNFLDENNSPFSAGWKPFIFWFLTTPYDDLRNEEITYIKDFIINKYKNSEQIYIEYFANKNLLYTIKNLKNTSKLSVIEDLYNEYYYYNNRWTKPIITINNIKIELDDNNFLEEILSYYNDEDLFLQKLKKLNDNNYFPYVDNLLETIYIIYNNNNKYYYINIKPFIKINNGSHNSIVIEGFEENDDLLSGGLLIGKEIPNKKLIFNKIDNDFIITKNII